MQRIIGGLGAGGGRHRLHVRRQSIARTASWTHPFPFIGVFEAGGGAVHVQRSAAEPTWIRLINSLDIRLDLFLRDNGQLSLSSFYSDKLFLVSEVLGRVD